MEAWEPACVETSQYIKSHETAPTLQISYCIVIHIKKKKNERILCAYERKATCTGDSCLYLLHAWILRQTMYFNDLTRLNVNVHLKSRGGYTYMDIPHTIIWSAVLKSVRTWDKKQTTVCETYLVNQIELEQSGLLCYGTEGSTPMLCECGKSVLGGLQEETNKNDSGCRARQVSTF